MFSNGILFLAGAAALLLIAFGGKTNALIPLYAVGVFTSFTLSQLGMVRYIRHAQDVGLETARGRQRRPARSRPSSC